MEIKDILIAHNFRYNKALGQNFITDKNLLSAIVGDAGIEKKDTVVEIGAGAGSLTMALSKVCKKVIAFEVDYNLKPILSQTLQGLDNVELVFADVLKLADEQIKDIVKGPFKVVANLPYYITTPLIMRFFESSLDIKSLTLMMQKEVAQRLVAKKNTQSYGAITAVIALQANAYITRNIPKQLFFPKPNVDSALVHIDIVGDKYNCKDINFVKKVIKSAFMWRRKTLANNLIATFSLSRKDSQALLENLGFEANIRGEKLSPEEFCKLAFQLKKVLKESENK
ncbi:MAG: ribosomal RNA small subunit methyltransferase A [Clostridiales bacterium]|nr:ribosomal RNA small subunit methyltransferase A [Clostridiales bacterium]